MSDLGKARSLVIGGKSCESWALEAELDEGVAAIVETRRT